MQPAQAPEVISKAGEYYLTQGVLGVTCLVLAFVVVYLFRKLDKQSTAITAMVGQISAALQANTAATAAGTVATESLKTNLDMVARAFEGLSRQVEVSQMEARGRGEAIFKNQERILDKMEDRPR